MSTQADQDLLSSVLGQRKASDPLAKKKKKKHKDKCEHLSDFPLQPTVQLGIESESYTLNVSGTFTCYASSEYESGALHTVLLGRDIPLSPATQYFYRTGDPDLGWSREFNFTTPVPVSKHSMPYR